MKFRHNYRSLIITALLPLALYAGSDNEGNLVKHYAIADEMLIKPSIINLEEQNLLSSVELENFAAQNDSQNKTDFFSNLQANFGSIAAPQSNLSSNPAPFNTWVPKFVWIGDVTDNDNLKCFAAFLIGSLADKNNSQQQVSPGQFMIPVTTTANPNQSGSYTVTPIQTTQNLSSNAQQTTMPANQMISRKSEDTTPPPMPASSRFYSEIQAGLAFLYFSDVKGNLVPQPNNMFAAVSGFNNSTGSATEGFAARGNPNSFPIRGSIEYNRTPIYTFDIGYRLMNWLSFAATFQTQQGVFIRTKPIEVSHNISGQNTTDQRNLVRVNFQSNLDLYSVGGKFLFNWPNMFKFKTWTLSLFIAGSVAGAWQSWTDVQASQMYFAGNDEVADTMTSSNISFRSKYFANFSYTGDAGFVFKPSNIFAKSSLRLGCKFIGWGSARGLGALKDQNDLFRDNSSSVAFGTSRILFRYFKPFSIGTIYSWAPYIGFKWEF